MMTFRIRETGELKTLSITDSNNIDYTEDFIGNTKAFLSGGEFAERDDNGYIICAEADYDWWEDVLKVHQHINIVCDELKRIDDLADVYDEICDIIATNDIDWFVNTVNFDDYVVDQLNKAGYRMTIHSNTSITIAKGNHDA